MVPETIISNVTVIRFACLCFRLCCLTVHGQDNEDLIRTLDDAETICVTVGIHDIHDIYYVFDQSPSIALPHISVYWPNLYVRVNAWYGTAHILLRLQANDV